MLTRLSTRSGWNTVARYIQKKKFYSTLPHKLDAAEEEFFRLQKEVLKNEGAFDYTENVDGETLLGGEMKVTWNPNKDSKCN